jgi:hypothetical protein
VAQSDASIWKRASGSGTSHGTRQCSAQLLHAITANFRQFCILLEGQTYLDPQTSAPGEFALHGLGQCTVALSLEKAARRLT